VSLLCAFQKPSGVWNRGASVCLSGSAKRLEQAKRRFLTRSRSFSENFRTLSAKKRRMRTPREARPLALRAPPKARRFCACCVLWCGVMYAGLSLEGRRSRPRGLIPRGQADDGLPPRSFSSGNALRVFPLLTHIAFSCVYVPVVPWRSLTHKPILPAGVASGAGPVLGQVCLLLGWPSVPCPVVTKCPGFPAQRRGPRTR
jgi:hypothetical protein